jgi:hypothetical protein
MLLNFRMICLIQCKTSRIFRDSYFSNTKIKVLLVLSYAFKLYTTASQSTSYYLVDNFCVCLCIRSKLLRLSLITTIRYRDYNICFQFRINFLQKIEIMSKIHQLIL